MLHVRLVVPPHLSVQVLDLLTVDTVVHLTIQPGHVDRPAGDLISFDLPPEAANELLGHLRSVGLAQQGSIMIHRVDTVLSATADRAMELAPGDPTEAVVWEDVKARVDLDSRLTGAWLLLLVIAVLIAAVGVLTDSAVLIVGAMVVGPEYGPVASVAVGMHLARWPWIRRGVVDLVVGFGLAVPLAALMSWVLDRAGTTPDVFATGSGTATAFISQPDVFSIVVATLAGVAGALSLTLVRTSTLVGVLISVTTVPAAAAMGVYASHGRWDDVGGSAAQLGSNLVLLAVAGAATLRIQRALHLRTRRRRTVGA